MWVTLNRPEVRNALSRDVNIRLQEIASDLEQRLDEIRVVVLTGTGDKAFCAGADLKERKGVSAAETGPYLNAIANAIEGFGAIKQPTICMMNGSAYGGGLEIAMACDFRVLVDICRRARDHRNEAMVGIAFGVPEPRLFASAPALQSLDSSAPNERLFSALDRPRRSVGRCSA